MQFLTLVVSSILSPLPVSDCSVFLRHGLEELSKHQERWQSVVVV